MNNNKIKKITNLPNSENWLHWSVYNLINVYLSCKHLHVSDLLKGCHVILPSVSPSKTLFFRIFVIIVEFTSCSLQNFYYCWWIYIMLFYLKKGSWTIWILAIWNQMKILLVVNKHAHLQNWYYKIIWSWNSWPQHWMYVLTESYLAPPTSFQC